MQKFNLINFEPELLNSLIPVHSINLELKSCCLLFGLLGGCFLILILFNSVSFMDSADNREDQNLSESSTGTKIDKGKRPEDIEKLSIILEAQLAHNNLMRQQGRFRTSYNHFPVGTPGHLDKAQCNRLATILKVNPVSYAKYDFGILKTDAIFIKNTLIYTETDTQMISIVRFHETMQEINRLRR
jgi:hypothetical protein